MLRILDPRKTGQTVHSFKDICKKLLIEEVKAGKFSNFHPKPYAIFANAVPPDLGTLIDNMRAIHPRIGKANALDLARKRRVAYRKFLSDPEKDYDAFVDTQYKPTKSWRQNWVEFVRDYADLAAYCGLLPAYFKNPLLDSEEDGYLFSDRARRYLDGSLSPEAALCGMKYANSSINLTRYPQFNITLRPFYATLRLLLALEASGVTLIDKKLLGAAIGCLRSEAEIQDAANLIGSDYGRPIAKFSNRPRTSKDFVREGERFSLSLVAFLKAQGLVHITSGTNAKLVRIATKGRALVDATPPNATYYAHSIGNLRLTPLLGYLLNLFTDYASKGRDTIEYVPFRNNLEALVDASQLEQLIHMISSRLHPSPILSFDGSVIKLQPITHQYAVTPGTDFASLAESGFVERGAGSIIIKPSNPTVTRPPETFLSQIKATSLGSDGSAYEDIIATALRSLKLGMVRSFGHTYSGQRFTDIVWEVPIYDATTNSEMTLLILIEAKAGGAIKQFDERAARDDIITTLKERYSKVLPKIAGIWVWVVDSDSIPSSNATHGGARPGSKTFEEKMHEMLTLMSFTQRLVVVTVLSADSFTEYYSYLFGAFPQLKPPLTEVNIQNFWIWGPAFRPLNGYVFIYDDVMELRRKLMIA